MLDFHIRNIAPCIEELTLTFELQSAFMVGNFFKII